MTTFDPLNPDGFGTKPERRATEICRATVLNIRDKHRWALANHVDQPIILLFDLSDRQSRRIALEQPNRQDVEKKLAEHAGGSDHTTPFAAIAVSFEWVKTSLADRLAGVPEFFVLAPSGPEDVAVVVFTGGIASFQETGWFVYAADEEEAVTWFDENEAEFFESLDSRERWEWHPPGAAEREGDEREGDEWKST
jgi:hypothetical protein